MKKNRDKVRSEYIMVLMTPEEKERVRQAADDVGVTLSAFARLALVDYLKKSNN